MGPIKERLYNVAWPEMRTDIHFSVEDVIDEVFGKLRCEHCKHWQAPALVNAKPTRGKCSRYGWVTDADFFCALWEPKS